MTSPIVVEIESLEGTRAFAQKLAGLLEPGDTVVLEGPLGAGKTSLSRELLFALGVDEDEVITSPTFAILHEYEGRALLVHADLYRLEHPEEVGEIGLDELQAEGAISLIEWGLRFEQELEGVVLLIELGFLKRRVDDGKPSQKERDWDEHDSQRRLVRVHARSERGEKILRRLAQEGALSERPG